VDTTIRLWDPQRGTESARLEGHAGKVYALCLLPDGRLASGSTDRTIRLWDPQRGTETACLRGHDGYMVTALCLLPDGRLASGSTDNTIRLWDRQSGAETARLEIDAPTTSCAVLADCGLVAGDLAGRLHWLEIVN
jgi:WD40 repeat protein